MSGAKAKKGKIIMLISDPFSNDKRALPEALALKENGYKVEALGWDRQKMYPAKETLDDIKIERFQLRSKYGLGAWQILKIPRFWLWIFTRMIFRDFDIVHCHDLDTLPIGFLMAKIRGKKVIYDSHESFPDTVREKSEKLWRFTLWLEKRIIRHVDCVITVGELLVSALIERGARKVALIGNWKDKNNYSFAEIELADMRDKLGIGAGLVICYLGMLDHKRRILPLIEEVKGDKEVYLILGGDGIHRKEIEEAIKGVENIKYVKVVPLEEAPKYIMISDVIYCCFDRQNRNARFTAATRLFDALAAGKALIVTRGLGDVGRVVEEYSAGVPVEEPDRDHLKKAIGLLKEEGKLRYYQSNARAVYSKKYNWENAKRELLNTYEGILK